MTEDVQWDAGLAPAERKRADRSPSGPPESDVRITSLELEVRALREELTRSQASIESMLRSVAAAPSSSPSGDEIGHAIATLQSDVALMASCLSTLVGGPTLADLMARIDDLAEQLAGAENGRRRKRWGRSASGR